MQGVKHMQNLEELWASYNQIADWHEVEGELRPLTKLNTVYFEGNPLQLKAPGSYRNKVRLMLPQLLQIDASEYIFIARPFWRYTNGNLAFVRVS